MLYSPQIGATIFYAFNSFCRCGGLCCEFAVCSPFLKPARFSCCTNSFVNNKQYFRRKLSFHCFAVLCFIHCFCCGCSDFDRNFIRFFVGCLNPLQQDVNDKVSCLDVLVAKNCLSTDNYTKGCPSPRNSPSLASGRVTRIATLV